MNEQTLVMMLAAGFFAIAMIYSSVGFGGGSSYLALLALVIPDFMVIKTAALFCNLVVVAGGSYLFFKSGYFNAKKFLPLAACSIPAAFAGATIHLTQKTFFIFLGGVLVISGILLVVQLFMRPKPATATASSLWANVILGSGTGFLSGLVGIGGGIILSPILNLLRWDEAKRIASLASFFILVNSVAGLLGQAAGGSFRFRLPLMGYLLAAVFLGGQLGTRVSLRVARPEIIKGVTGILVCYAGIKLVLQYSFGIKI